MAKDGLPIGWTGRGRATAGPAFAGLALLVGFVSFPLQVVGPEFSHLPGDLVDNRLNNYVLEHGYRWLTGRVPEFWHAPFSYPARWMTARSDSHIGNLPIYFAFRTLGAGPERAFQLWWLSTFALNFASAIWAARRLGIGWVGSTVAAYVFAFGLPVTASLPHAQLAPRYFVPPAVALTWLGLVRPSWRNLLAVAGCLVGQMYCTVYIGYFLVWLLAAVGISAVLCRGRSLPWREWIAPPRREFLARAAVVFVAAAALAPLARAHLFAARDSHSTSVDVVLSLTPKPGDWVRPAAGSVAWEWLGKSEGGPLPTFDLFPGGLAVVGLLAGIGCFIASWASSRLGDVPNVRLSAGMAAAVVLIGAFMLQVDGWSPYRSILGLPGATGIRAPFRVVLVLLFPLGLLAGIAAAAVATTAQRMVGEWCGAISACVLLAVVAGDHTNVTRSAVEGGYGRYAIAGAIARREALTSAVRAVGRPSVFYAFPGRAREGTEPLVVHVDAMWASLETGVPTVNGYTGHWPRDWFPFENYAELFHWLRIRGILTHKLLGGFVAFGDPTGFDDRPAERESRAAYPTRPLPSSIP